MKKITLLFLFLSSFAFAQVQNANFSVSPATFEEDEEITITVSGVNPSTWGVSDIYLWAWSFNEADLNQDPANAVNSPTNGSWTNSNEAQKMTDNGNGTFSFTLTPSTFYARTGLKRIGVLVKAKNGDGDKKSQDQLFEIGTFQMTITSPTVNSTILNSGENFSIAATASLPANFNLKADGTSIDQKTNLLEYTYQTTVTENTTYVLEGSNNGVVKTASFNVIVRPTPTEAALPNGLKDGVTINGNKTTFVLYAPNKDFVHLIGSFNDWKIDNTYLLKKDTAKNRFWIEIEDLPIQENITYQYIIDAKIKIADPYSTTILDPFEDQYIDATTYPNLAPYPTGKTEHAVTLLRIGDAEYNWQITNFEKPKKTDLVIYELLIRDFDELHSFDAVKARLNYLKELGVNAIEFMPVNEFDGNLSWGYNPSFHMALDKYYGTKNSFKQLIDECHKLGMAVILDVVYNHASGQNPMFRMYSSDSENYEAQVTANSPFFNEVATHSYSVFNDFNHSEQAVKDYVKQTAQYWISEYNIDGFRWDLTKGFTQNCLNDEGCTNAEQADRVAILKEYADYQWEKDPDFYVIFEHLGTNSEETKWINYRLNEGKGIMVWGNHHGTYKNAALGSNSGGNSDFSWVSYKNRGWSKPQNVSYMVSHDEERLMYENLNFGLSNSNYNTKDVATALDRMELNAAFYFTIPGPKMIWQFDELGYDISINKNGRTGSKPILWNYFDVQDRKDVYNTWAKLVQLKLKYEIFETTDFTIDASNSNGLKKIQLTNTSATDIQYINVIGNFGLTTQNINPVFQTTGTWYDLLNDDNEINVANSNSLIALAPGEFKVYGNKPAALSTEDLFIDDSVSLYPNPSKGSFKISSATSNVEIFDLNGKRVRVFKGNFDANHAFTTQGIETGLYLLITKNEKGKILKKLIVE